MHWHIMQSLDRLVGHLSATQTAAIGGAGAVSSLATVLVDPAFLTPWLQLAAVAIGILTGAASFVLVWLKILKERRS